MKTKSLSEVFPQLAHEVIIDNKNLVVQHILPFPPKLYEQVIAAAVGDDHQQAGQVWQQPASVILSRVEQFLIRLRTASLAYHEHQVWSDVHDYQSYTFKDSECDDFTADMQKADTVKEKVKPVSRAQLRRQRRTIYASLSSDQSVESHLEKYKSLTEAFIQRFKSELPDEEVDIFKNRLKRTENSVRVSKLDNKNPIKCDLVHKIELLKPDSVKTDEEENYVDDYDNDVDAAKLLVGDERSEMNLQLSDIEEQDDLFLPDVPHDSEDDAAEASASVIDDDEIQRRLTRLKFFSQAWSQPAEVSNIKASCSIAEPREKDNTAAVISTEADRLDFNQWYYATVEKEDLAMTRGSQDVVKSTSTESVVNNAKPCSKAMQMLDMVPNRIEEEKSMMARVDMATKGAYQDMIIASTTLSLVDIPIDFLVPPSEFQDSFSFLNNDSLSDIVVNTSGSFSMSQTATMDSASVLLDKVMGSFNESQVTLDTTDGEIEYMEDKIRMLKSQEAEIIASMQLYQSYLVGLVAVCTFFYAKMASDEDSTPAPSVTSPHPPTTSSFASALSSEMSPVSDRECSCQKAQKRTSKKSWLRKSLNSSWNCFRKK